MSQVHVLVRLEWTRTWRDPVIVATLALLALVSAYAAIAGARWVAQREATVHQAVAEANETMALRRKTFATTVAKGDKPNFGLVYATAWPFRAGLPNAPLAALSAGQAEGYPAAASIAPFLDPYAIFDRHMAGLESPAVLAAGRFDLAFVIIVLLPLLLIAVTYDFWSRDVESGAARFQLAQPVRPAALIAGRVAIRGGVLLVGGALITVLALLLAGGRSTGDLTLVAAVVLAYGLVWLALVLCINLVVRASTTAALVAGTVWLVLVVLLPAMLAAVATLAAPKPSAMTYANAVRMAGLEVRARNAAAARVAANADSRRAYPATLWHSRREIAERDARLHPIHVAYSTAQARHRDAASLLRLASPAVIAQDALDRIAGTDADRAVAFQNQARAFAGEMRRLALDWMDRNRLMTLADYERGLPRFAFTEPSRGAAFAGDLFALLVFAVALFSLAAWRLRRGPATLV